MKKILILVTVMGSLLSACLPAFLQPDTAGPTPISKADLEATAAILIQQTLEALPTPTVAPSNTPVVKAATSTATQATQTETANPELPTSSVTLSTTNTGSPAANTTGTQAGPGAGTLPFTLTPNAATNVVSGTILTETPHPQHYGTLPPFLPFGKISLVNKSKSQVYISLQCTTKEGFTTIIEYPVSGTIDVKAPLGRYTYVAWVGGKQIVGKFTLEKDSDLTIKIFKDHLDITKKK